MASSIIINLVLTTFLIITWGFIDIPAIIKIVLALLFLFFSPGYAFIASLFPNNDSIDFSQRIVFSVGTSISFVIIVALVLNYSPYGLSQFTLSVALLFIVSLSSIIALIRSKRISHLVSSKVGNGFSHKFYWVIPLILIVIFLIISSYIVVYQDNVRITEFYLMRENGIGEAYPEQVVNGDQISIVTGIKNHEGMPLDCSIFGMIGGSPEQLTDSIHIEDSMTWEDHVSFSLSNLGDSQLVSLQLFCEGKPFPYRSLQFWVNVKP
jgi:uncharacterized membrane protein